MLKVREMRETLKWRRMWWKKCKYGFLISSKLIQFVWSAEMLSYRLLPAICWRYYFFFHFCCGFRFFWSSRLDALKFRVWSGCQMKSGWELKDWLRFSVLGFYCHAVVIHLEQHLNRAYNDAPEQMCHFKEENGEEGGDGPSDGE